MSYKIETTDNEIIIKGKIELRELNDLIKLYKKRGFGDGLWGDENSVIRLKKLPTRERKNINDVKVEF
jgi:hypothetical protein